MAHSFACNRTLSLAILSVVAVTLAIASVPERAFAWVGFVNPPKDRDSDDDRSDPQGDDDCQSSIGGSKGPGLHVNIASGNVWAEVPVLTAFGDGEVSLDLKLIYNSILSDRDDVGLGYGWTHNLAFRYSETIESTGCNCTPECGCSDQNPCGCRYVIAPPKVILIDGDGRQNVYYKRASVGYDGQPDQPDGIVGSTGRNGVLTLASGGGETYRLSFPDGSNWFYRSESGTGVISRMISARGLTTRFVYGDTQNPGRLTGVIDGFGRKVTFEYTSDQLTRIYHPDDTPSHRIFTEMTYDDATCPKRLKLIRDPLGYSVHYGYGLFHHNSGSGDPCQGFHYITDEFLKNGRHFTCTYDDDNSGGTLDKMSRTIRACNGIDCNHVILYVESRDFPLNRDGEMAGPHDSVEVDVMDGNGVPWVYFRDAGGHVVVRYPSSGSNYYREARYGGDDSGDHDVNLLNRVKSTKNGLELVRNFEWGPRGALTKLIVHAESQYVTEYRYDDARFPVLPTSRTEPNGGYWTFLYNAQGDATTVRDALNNTEHRGYEYCADSDLPPGVPGGTLLPGRVSQVTRFDRNNNKTVSLYAANGDLASMKVYTDGTLYIETTYLYDAMGRRKRESVARGDGSYAVTACDYDLMGRQITVVQNPVTGGTGFDQNLTTNYEYDEHGLLKSVTNPKRTTTTYTYDYRNYLTKIVEDAGPDKLNLTTNITPDDNGNPATVEDPEHHTTTKKFDAMNNVSLLVDAESYRTQFDRDGEGNVTTLRRDLERPPANATTPPPVVYTADYDGLNRLRSRNRLYEPPTTYDYAWTASETSCSCGQGTNIPHKITYNGGAGSSNAVVTYNEVDLLARLTRTVRKVGSDDGEQPDNDDAVTTLEYDNEGNLTKRIGPEGEMTQYAYDGADRLTGRIVRADPFEQLVTSYQRNGVGNAKSASLPNGHVINFGYDAADRVQQVYDSIGDQVVYSYDANGNILNHTDGLGHTWQYTYDALDRRIVEKDPVFENPDKFTTYAYDGVGNLIEKDTLVDAGQSSNRIRTHYDHDGIDRLTRVIEDYDPNNAPMTCDEIRAEEEKRKLDGESEGGLQEVELIEGGGPSSTPTPNTTTEYVYDGRFLRELRDSDCNATLYRYNDTGDLDRITYPGGSVVNTEHQYSQRQVDRSDSRGWHIAYHFDQLDHLKEKHYYGSGSSGIAPRNGKSDTFTFDRSGRLTGAATDNALYSWSRAYDLAGRPMAETQGFGTSASYVTELEYALDAEASTLTQSVCYPNGGCGAGGNRQVQRTFDARGRLVDVSAGTGVGASWSFDAADRRVLGRRHSGLLHQSAWGSDDDDRVTNITHYGAPGGFDMVPFALLHYSYDSAGNRLSSRKDSLGGPTNRSERYNYDNRNRLVQMERGVMGNDGAITNQLVDGSLAGKQQWADLDRRGNWKDYQESIGGADRRELREVSGVNAYTCIEADSSPGAATCTTQPNHVAPAYDAAGNLTFDPLARQPIDPCGPSKSYGLPSAQQPTAPDCRYNGQCDPSRYGCGKGLEYEYDEDNRLTKVLRDTNDAARGYGGFFSPPAETGVFLEIKYDALGRRVESIEYVDADGTVLNTPRHTRHVYAGLETIQEYACGGTYYSCDAGFTLTREFVWGDGNRFPEPVAMLHYMHELHETQPGQPPIPPTPHLDAVYHYLHDSLGSVVGLTESTGEVVERYTYDPYGKTFIEKKSVTTGNWSQVNTSAFGNPFMWTGQRYDAAVGLYAFWARTFSPALGRWLQRDPVGSEDGVNLYEYVLSDPLDWVDPQGLTKGGKQNIRPSFVTGEETLEKLEKLLKELEDAGKEKAAKSLRSWIKVVKRTKIPPGMGGGRCGGRGIGGAIGGAIIVVLTTTDPCQAAEIYRPPSPLQQLCMDSYNDCLASCASLYPPKNDSMICNANSSARGSCEQRCGTKYQSCDNAAGQIDALLRSAKSLIDRFQSNR